MNKPNYKALALASLKRILDGTLAPTHEPDINGICSLVANDPESEKVLNELCSFKLVEALHEAWQEMNLRPCNPLGDYFQDGNLWKGERGERRFDLVRKTIEYLENT